MKPIDFLRGLFFHVTAATLILAVILLAAEKLVPSSVMPFIDVIDLLPVLLFLIVICAIWVKPKESEKLFK
ncbi:hypothetical protein KKF59_00375 [Patescibacteria group bacterium]|nr:hypothetical protein [Patescibacteria group bacterium]MBU1907572.1 hypothetical protein [Patescibacteria group bacterium]